MKQKMKMKSKYDLSLCLSLPLSLPLLLLVLITIHTHHLSRCDFAWESDLDKDDASSLPSHFSMIHHYSLPFQFHNFIFYSHTISFPSNILPPSLSSCLSPYFPLLPYWPILTFSSFPILLFSAPSPLMQPTSPSPHSIYITLSNIYFSPPRHYFFSTSIHGMN